MSPVPVLMYHHVNPLRGDTVTVTPEVFEGQMSYLRRAGYRTLGLDELLSFINGGLELDGRAVAVTFDDGYLDNYAYAFPVLREHSIKASVFIVTSWVDSATGIGGNPSPEEAARALESMMTPHGETRGLIEGGRAGDVIMGWGMVEEMERSGLVGFYSHTMSHRGCDGMGGEEMQREIAGSKEAVERRLGKECPYLCWPRGSYNGEAARVAREAGYRALFTTERGVVRRGDDPFCIKRIVVRDDVSWLKRKLRIYTGPVLSRLYLRARR